MSQSLAIPRFRSAETGRVRHRHLWLGAALGALLGALGFAAAESALGVVRAAFAPETAVAENVREFPSRELPREWRWEPQGVRFEHMYRQKGSPRLDWIRENGGR